jgi:ATP/maltotriose-dependent transcriptional regulator MalT
LGQEDLNRSLKFALDHGFLDLAGRALTCLAWSTMLAMRLDEADRRFSVAVDFAIEHDHDFRRWYLLARRTALHVRQGAWDAVELEARHVLRQPMLSPVTRLVALTALGQVGARRGSLDAAPALDEALALAERNGQQIRLWPVRVARAEEALLNGDRNRAQAEARAVRDAVFTRGNQWHQGELAWLLWQAGDRDVPTDNLAKPYALQIAGDFAATAAAWSELGCPYDEACALVESDDPALVRRGAAIFEELRARPALRHAIRRLRALGIRDPRPLRPEPRAATRASSHGLTARELEVLRLLAAGYSNREVGEQLFISPTTAARHVANIYSKLGVDSRAQATTYAHHHGLT